MKLKFKIKVLLIFLPIIAKGESLITISYAKEQILEFFTYKKLLFEKFYIPKWSIHEVQSKNPCHNETHKNTLIHICLSKDNSLRVLYQNKSVEKGALKIFFKEINEEI